MFHNIVNDTPNDEPNREPAMTEPEMQAEGPHVMLEAKNYIEEEMDRNKAHGPLFARLVAGAFGDHAKCQVAHHILVELDGDHAVEFEIPAADTVLFSTDIMPAVFGRLAAPLMVLLSMLPPGEREKTTAHALELQELEMLEEWLIETLQNSLNGMVENLAETASIESIEPNMVPTSGRGNGQGTFIV